jgi:hypothetical protein
MNKAYIRKNIKYISIILFLFVFYMVIALKPAFLFEPDGSIKNFGFGHTNKTILPVWLIAVVLGILSYMSVLYYIIL